MRAVAPDAPVAAAALLSLVSAPVAWLGAPIASLAWLAPLLMLYAAALRYLLTGPKRVAHTAEDDAGHQPHPLQQTALSLARFTAAATTLLAIVAAFMWYFQPAVMLRVSSGVMPSLPWDLTSDTPATMALFAAIAMLVSTAPAAFVLSTPTALRVAMEHAASRGIHLSHPATLQHLRDVSIAVLDKSGALTHNTPRVVEVEPAPGVTREELLAVAATAESASPHPIARAVVECARRDRIAPYEVEEPWQIPGRGAIALLDEERLAAGKESWQRELGIDTRPLDHTLYRMHHEAKTTVVASRGRRLLGVIALTDSLKKDSVRAVKILARMQVRAFMLTGEAAASARMVAEQMGITEVVADVLPEDKTRAIERIKTQTIHKVAYAANATEDAQALAVADVSLAMESRQQPQDEAIHVALAAGDIMPIVTALQLARATHSTILQNLFIASIYSIAASLIAITGLLHPLIALTCSALCAATVVANARRLQNFDPQAYTAEVMRR